MTDSQLIIAHLVDVPEAVPTLVRWYVDAWTPWYGPGGRGSAERDLAACGSRDALPICLVAQDHAGDLLGTAALKRDPVGSEAGTGPWLAALLVGAEYRGRGVGRALVRAIQTEAARLGFSELYTSTDHAEAAMRRHGWQPCGGADSLRGPITIFRRTLGRDGDGQP